MIKKVVIRVLIVFVLLIVVRMFVQGRYIPSSSMEPTLVIGDRILIELVTHNYERGAIICFYPPVEYMGGKDRSWEPMHVLGRLTGLPMFPNDPVFMDRVIGVANDVVRIEPESGVFVNGKLLNEPYVWEKPNYELKVEGDIGGRDVTGGFCLPYPESKKEIVVPKDSLFVLGDNRNNSVDSHVFGYIKTDRVLGRAMCIWNPISENCWAPYWVRPKKEAE